MANKYTRFIKKIRDTQEPKTGMIPPIHGDKINIQELDKSNQTAKYSIFIEKPIIGEASSFNDYIKSNSIDKKMVDGKAHKIDGPFIKMEYNGNSLNYFYYQQNKLHPENWAEITNHIICNICEEFCNQGCFQRNFDD